MQADLANSRSPRVSVNPVTPIHSAQHSLNSSISSRTPLQTLSLHEYRKLQNSPAAQSSTPPGRTLRRKAAASALNELERVPSSSAYFLSGSVRSRLARPLHLSQSAQQLTSYQPLPPSPPHDLDQPELSDSSFRSQSAEPRALSGTKSWLGGSGGVHKVYPKVSNWKAIKKLPHPASAHPKAHNSPAFAVSTFLPSLATSSPSTENLLASGANTDSTFSLSRFPHPPPAIDPLFSPSNDENTPPRVNSFATTAPVTPPATPAVLHYRGTSFDLVNPHESLLLHDVVTPSRDFDSSEYLPLRSSEDPLVYYENMAPRRPLYEDLGQAYSSIKKRDNSPQTPQSSRPSHQGPATASPASSAFSPGQSNLREGSSPAVASQASEPKVSTMKRLTKTFKRREKNRNHDEEGQELDEFTNSPSPAHIHFGGEFPRPLHETYPTSPSASQNRTGRWVFRPEELGDEDYDNLSTDEVLSGHTHRELEHPVDVPGLSSMVPDEPSTQVGRGQQASSTAGELNTRAYYDDSSIYGASSIYTGDGDESHGGVPPSLYSKRLSNMDPLFFDEEEFSNPYKTSTTYTYANPNRNSTRRSRSMLQDAVSRSQLLRYEKTDTIEKFIDQYDEHELGDNSRQSQVPRTSSGFSQFDFELPQASPSRGKAPITRNPGAPPLDPAPLAPPFEYDDILGNYGRPNTSDLTTAASSYGDTRNLLRLGQPSDAHYPTRSLSGGQGLQSSSSYSQRSSQASTTPQEALDHAEKIFDEAQASARDNRIPAMWSRSGSGNLLRNRHSGFIPGIEEENGDWETIDNNSGHARPSMDDSIADYSSTNDSEAEQYVLESSLPVLPVSPDRLTSPLYRHPTPLGQHQHPFGSSPPGLVPRASVRSAPEEQQPTFVSSDLPSSSTAPDFQSTARGYHDQPHQVTHASPPGPVGQYGFTDHNTIDLLNSGPNEDILYENESDVDRDFEHGLEDDLRGQPWDDEIIDAASSDNPRDRSPMRSPFHSGYNAMVERENSFEKVSTLGPKGNLTGTPKGTGMQEVGSSVADTSSPGVNFTSSPPPQDSRSSPGQNQQTSSGPGFYRDPSQRSSRVIIPRQPQGHYQHNRSVSQGSSLYEHHMRGESLAPPTPLLSRARTTRSPGHRHDRPSVAGQTRLREMVLAPDVQTISSGGSTTFSQFIGDGLSERPSTGNTVAPLRGRRAPPVAIRPAVKVPVAHEHSPRLLCPERQLNPEDERSLRRSSWILFCLCLLFPPSFFLYWWAGDKVIALTSKGKFNKCHGKTKTWALVAGSIGSALCVLTIVLVCVRLIPLR
ncbi:hypothetical protein K491DRAFT_709777 [Lophiostoma macrostomum CBS 122681]|uniref:Uncharacterized protein n=1 Tax=Lophiostoma macrostomum CBS 122681 TaxID=1314788 RepID=A0A6A6TTA3_9PLEO|nr:hypothetical protein K491DRAFT_709777 [Lophiostoma macrostomum CBS 122681]